jgi:hypothetical protein
MDDRTVALIDEIYALIKDPSGLQALVGRIADWRGADKALLTAPPLPGCTPVPLMAYKLDFTPVLSRPDMLMRPEFTSRAVETGRAPGVFTLDELMPPPEQETNEYWQVVIAPLGITSGVLTIARTAQDNMRPVSLNLFRQASSKPFDAEDVQSMAALLPHLRCALGLLLDAPKGLTSFEQDMDFSALNTPVFSLDQSAGVARCNEAAELLLESGDGIALRDDRLVLHDSDLQRELDAALDRVIGDDWSNKMRNSAEVTARRPSGLPAFSLVAIPTGADNPIATAAASIRCLVFVYGDTRTTEQNAGRDDTATPMGLLN